MPPLMTYEEKVHELNQIFAGYGLAPIGSDLGPEPASDSEQIFIRVSDSTDIESEFDSDQE
jgi:hypothetical protein